MCVFMSVLLTGGDTPVTTIYGRPVPVVMKLMRVLATAGRHVAALLVCHRLFFDKSSSSDMYIFLELKN